MTRYIITDTQECDNEGSLKRMCLSKRYTHRGGAEIDTREMLGLLELLVKGEADLIAIGGLVVRRVEE